MSGETLYLYVRLRLAYRRRGVTPYSRRKTWDEARFAARTREARRWR